MSQIWCTKVWPVSIGLISNWVLGYRTKLCNQAFPTRLERRLAGRGRSPAHIHAMSQRNVNIAISID